MFVRSCLIQVCVLVRSPIVYRVQFRSGGWRANGQEVALGSRSCCDCERHLLAGFMGEAGRFLKLAVTDAC